jgi:CRP/FNR family transcriptional regulator
MNCSAMLMKGADCRHCDVRHDSDWSRLSAEDTARVNRIKTWRTLAEGDVLFRQGEPNAGIYVVSSGLFAQRIVHENGTDVIVAIVSQGQTLGARAFLRNSPHATTAVALVPSGVCMIRRHDAVRLTREAPEAHMALVACCLNALDRSQAELLHNAALGTRARLAALLLRFLGDRAMAGSAAIHVPLSRSDIAGILGILPESLSRLLRQLREEGLIRASGRSFDIPRIEMLADLAASGPGF